MTKKYSRVAVGGTFDHFHQGHKRLFDRAFGVASQVIVGITSDSFVSGKPMSDAIWNYSKRERNVRQFLQDRYPGNYFEIITLDDIYGTTLTDMSIEALIITPETKPGADLVNQKRMQLGLEMLPLEMVDLLFDQAQEKLASARIRMGVTDQQGRVFGQVFAQDIDLREVSSELKQPMGDLINVDIAKTFIHESRPRMIAVVGDVSITKFIENQIQADLMIFDNMTKREVFAHSSLPNWPRLKIQNPAGWVSSLAVGGLVQALEELPVLVEVEGEEDLLTLPLILLSPIGSVIYYGQPDEGLVQVVVDIETKNKWYAFVQKLVKSDM